MKIFEEIPTQEPSGEFLPSVNFPADLRDLDLKDLPKFSDELREYLLYSVGQTGGHFGAGLGVVELTTALHYVFDTPCLLYTSPSPRDGLLSRMPSSA